MQSNRGLISIFSFFHVLSTLARPMDDKLSRRPVVRLSSLSSYLGKLFPCFDTSSSELSSKLAALDVLSASQHRDRSSPHYSTFSIFRERGPGSLFSHPS